MKILCSEPPLKQLQKNVLCQKCDASIAYVFIKCIVLRFSFKIAENMFETKLSTTFKWRTLMHQSDGFELMLKHSYTHLTYYS